MSERTLLLTSWYFPIKVLHWHDAIKMKYEGTVDVVAEYEEEVCSVSVTWKMPAVVRLRRNISGKKRGIKFSRPNVYTRDNYKCQYCGRGPLHPKALSYDHVIPRSAGGRTTFENIVTACKTCNALKDNLSCDASGMWPRKKPVIPRQLPLTSPILDLETTPEEWKPFLPQAQLLAL